MSAQSNTQILDADIESDIDDVPSVEETGDDSDAGLDERKQRRFARPTPAMSAVLVGVVIVAALTALAGWLGFRTYEAVQTEREHARFVEAARQGAVNLTTIDWEHADADVQRILDSATGTFYDDFAKRSQPFVDVVKQTNSVSVGTVAAAGLETVSGEGAEVLVAMSVKTTNAGTPEPAPRSWRMRIDVQKVGDDVKVSNVEFVP